MQSNREINEYLFYEFGLDLDADSGRISEDWPFSLESVGVFHSPYGEREVRRFDAEGTTYYLIAGKYLLFRPADGLALDDLRREEVGAAWIAAGDPISLETARIGDESVPSTATRRAALQDLAGAAPEHGKLKILEGLFLRGPGTYVGIIEEPASGRALIVGTGIPARIAPAPGLPP